MVRGVLVHSFPISLHMRIPPILANCDVAQILKLTMVSINFVFATRARSKSESVLIVHIVVLLHGYGSWCGVKVRKFVR